MSLLSLLLLYLISRFNGDRTVSGIYHLLKGKRSSQTIQDGHLYQCLFLFGVLPRLERNVLQKELDTLFNSHYIMKEKEWTYKTTKKGKELLDSELKKYHFIFHLDGWKYKDMSSVFWSRLVLTIQSLSCVNARNRHFFPVIKDQQVKRWVRRNFPNQYERQNYSKGLYNELLTLLQNRSQLEAEIFTYKLSGSHRIGLTNEQLANHCGKDKYVIELIHLSVVQQILDQLQKNSLHFPILNTFISDVNQTIQMTNSTRQTYQLMKRGLSLEEIAARRQLKKSTIEDHIIEILLEDQTCDLSPFISRKEIESISTVVHKSNNKKLSNIKDQLPNEISYFKIRLVLARLANKKIRRLK